MRGYPLFGGSNRTDAPLLDFDSSFTPQFVWSNVDPSGLGPKRKFARADICKKICRPVMSNSTLGPGSNCAAPGCK